MRRPTLPPALGAAVVAGWLVTGCLVTGCTPAAAPDPAPRTAPPASVLGAVPIPSVPTGTPAPVTASVGHPQLLAMGAPVQVNLPGGQGLITTDGPTENLPPGGAVPGSAVTGVITVTVTAATGRIDLTTADLACRDETGAVVALAPVGPAAVVASPGHPATLRLSGTFHDGDAQINWRQAGHVIAIWDFTIEID